MPFENISFFEVEVPCPKNYILANNVDLTLKPQVSHHNLFPKLPIKNVHNANEISTCRNISRFPSKALLKFTEEYIN